MSYTIKKWKQILVIRVKYRNKDSELQHEPTRYINAFLVTSNPSFLILYFTTLPPGQRVPVVFTKGKAAGA